MSILPKTELSYKKQLKLITGKGTWSLIFYVSSLQTREKEKVNFM